MRGRLLLSVAAATLSLCVSSGYAQKSSPSTDDNRSKPSITNPAAQSPDTKVVGQKDDDRRAARKHSRSKNGKQTGAADDDGDKARGKHAADADKDKDKDKSAADDKTPPSTKPTTKAEDAPSILRPGAAGARDRNEQARDDDKDRFDKDRADKDRFDKDRFDKERLDRRAEDRDMRRQKQEADQGRTPTDRTGATATEQQHREGAAGRFERNDNARRPGDRMIGRDSRDFDRFERGVTTDRTRDAELRRDRAARRDLALDANRQSRIRNILDQRRVRSFSRSDFNVAIGAVLPPSVNFYPLPPDIVSIAPEYRGYDYVRVEDDFVIVDPDTREIVSVLDEGSAYDNVPPAERPRTATGPQGWQREGMQREGSQRREAYGYAAPRVRLNETQQRELYRAATEDMRAGLRQACVTVGDKVPDFVEIAPLPRKVALDADLERYQYFMLNDRMVLVDPDTRVVVDILDERR